jgi:predicted nucleic acid-binding protein
MISILAGLEHRMPKSSGLFVDASGWACLAVANDPCHAGTQAVYSSALGHQRQIMTTNMILAELVPLLDSRARIARQAVIAYVEHVRTSPYITIIHVDEAIDQAAWDMLKQYSDKSWSLVDATSFVVMRRFGIDEALTTDHHIEQAGFKRLPA